MGLHIINFRIGTSGLNYVVKYMFTYRIPNIGLYQAGVNLGGYYKLAQKFFCRHNVLIQAHFFRGDAQCQT